MEEMFSLIRAASLVALLISGSVLCSGVHSLTTNFVPSVNEPSTSIVQQPDGSDLRLPRDVVPEHYNVTLAPFIYDEDVEDFYFTGSVAIAVKVQRTTNEFKLHTKMLSLGSLWIFHNEASKNLSIESVEEDQRRQWHSVTLTEPLYAGFKYIIVVDRFRGMIGGDNEGLFLNVYADCHNGTAKFLVTSQLQATNARKVFPCFDEPDFKATFDVSLVRSTNFKAISNMPSKAIVNVSADMWFNSSLTEENSFVREDFETTPIMSTYLLAFLVSQLEHVSGKDFKGRVYRNWARPIFINMTDYALKAVINIVDFFEMYFGVDYPLNKTDQAIVQRHGAMENWGLIMYDEADLVMNPQLDTAEHQQGIDYLVSHELAHMWFGNLVTMAWWNEVWLNEGFASFVSKIGIDYLHPWCEMDSQFVVKVQAEAFVADSTAWSNPISKDVYTVEQVDRIFDDITYKKGATVIRMMYNFLGDEVFRKGVRHYLKSNSYKNTFDTNLYESLTQEVLASGRHLNVKEIMDRWIIQVGYPVLHCNRTTTFLTIQQEHFRKYPGQSLDAQYQSPYNLTWIIPITMATKENSSSWNGSSVWHLTQWLRTKQQRFHINGSGWYLLNLRSTGFYRVNYDADNWNALTEQLLTNHSVFTPQDRARLLDDAFSLASAEIIDFSVAFDLTDYLRHERHYAPWKAAVKMLDTIRFRKMKANRIESELFSAYMRAVIGPVYRSIRLKAATDAMDSHLLRLTRQLIANAAVAHGLRDFRTDARAQFDRFVRSNFTLDQLPPPDTRRAVLCEGLAGAPYSTRRRVRQLESSAPSPSLAADIWQSSDYYACRNGIRRRRRSSIITSGGGRMTDDGGLSPVSFKLREALVRMQRVA